MKNDENDQSSSGIIIKDGQVFATQRGYGEFNDWWEDALVREICEELEAEIMVGNLLETVEWDYPDFRLTMHCFICSLLSESLYLNEHEAATWLTHETLRSVKWLPVDEILLDRITEYLT